MVKWYNASLPRTSREFDSPWPHRDKEKPGFIPAFLVFIQKSYTASLFGAADRYQPELCSNLHVLHHIESGYLGTSRGICV